MEKTADQIKRTGSPRLLVLTIVSLVCGAMITILYGWSASAPKLWKCFLMAIPFAYFLFLYLGSRRHEVDRKAVKAASAVLIAVICASVWFIPNEAIATTTDVSAYQHILRRYQNSALTEHFPSEIPAESHRIDFFYTPPFLMGGEMLSLRCSMKDDEINRLELKYAATAVWSGSVSSAQANDKLPLGWLEIPFEDGWILSDDFTVYLFFSRPSQNPGDKDFIWNHGAYSMAAISHKQKIILWQCEQW